MSAEVISLRKTTEELIEQPTQMKPDWLCFKNEGEIDVRSIKTLGISVKEGSNPIGFFGTGLKYAISILLREGCEVIIYSGESSLHFEKKKISVRGSEFDVVCMNGEELSFTTELGKTWELWKAYRELFCNCKDETGQVSIEGNVSGGQQGYTTIYVKGLIDVHKNSSEYFIKTEPAFISNGIEFHPRTATGGIFYKGVKVHTTKKHCLFNYNIQTNIDLTEDRTAKFEWQVSNRIRDAILKADNVRLLEKILVQDHLSFEANLDYNFSSDAPSEEFLEVAGRLGTSAFPNAQHIFKKFALARGITQDRQLTSLENKMMERAMAFIKHLGYNDKYPIVVTDLLGHDILGQAEGGTIYISTRCFKLGTKQLAATIYEEWVHLQHGLQDESRSMQNFLFDEIMTMLEEKLQEAI